MTRHSGHCYEAISSAYADSVDSRPWNAFYERPATTSLLPDLPGKRILDAACGSGWYAEYLVRHGAEVVAFDLNEKFVEHTRKRVGNGGRVLRADLAEPLDFARDHEFDLIVCPLALHYLKDWEPTLVEFHRVLRPDGHFVFSTHHPTMDWLNFQTDSYFSTEFLTDHWDVGTVTFFRRPLTAICEALHRAGFVIERLLEPQPIPEFQKVDPLGFQRTQTSPGFLVIRARPESGT